MAKPISDIRRPEIVQATIKAIARLGLPMPSYDKIASEAGMSRQLIRHYFPQPESLMVAVCDALAGAYRDLLARGILQEAGPQRLTVLIDFYFDMLGDPALRKPGDDTVYDAMMALAATSEAVRNNLHDQSLLLQETIAHEVQIAHPSLHQIACREIGFLFVSLMYGHWKMVASLGFSNSHSGVTRRAMDRIVQSYLRPDDYPHQKI